MTTPWRGAATTEGATDCFGGVVCEADSYPRDGRLVVGTRDAKRNEWMVGTPPRTATPDVCQLLARWRSRGGPGERTVV